MGRFTALDDPVVDHIIESHLQRIVTAILTHLEPHAVVLRGSFGRGEGSVLPRGVHSSGLSFINATNGQGTDRRGVELAIGYMLFVQSRPVQGIHTSVPLSRHSAKMSVRYTN